MLDFIQFPRQTLSTKKKTASWRKKCVLWADSKSIQHYNPVRKSVRRKNINYDLVRGKLHMDDVAIMINPLNVDANYFPETIQHFPLINNPLEVLFGEELKRPFDWRVVVTNMNAVSDIEEAKKQDILNSLQEIIESTSISEEDYQSKLESLNEYYKYNYQDFREKRANEYLKHYSKEYNMPLIFNEGFKDGLIVGEEIYRCDIVGGEPILERLNPNKVRVYKSGYSNRIEDADIITIEDYWSPGKIIDTFYDQLTDKEVQTIETYYSNYIGNGVKNERRGFINSNMIDDTFESSGEGLFTIGDSILGNVDMPYDNAGNIRVLQVYWKSRRKIKKVKQYDPVTGESIFNFYSEDYILNTDLGEEEQPLWINEAWEGTLIGEAVYDANTGDIDSSNGIFVNMRPRPIQYSRLLNPSRCHFGIVGTIYNLNEDKPYSLVDMMKPYNYMYDAIMYRIMDAFANSWGSLAKVDLAMIPNKWDMDKWLYFAKTNHLAVVDSFNEGKQGAARGKLAGAMNNNTQGIISDASGNYIQQLINMAEYIKAEVGDIIGVSKQRQGQISNRETVGGVERAVLQSSYITERYFAIHNDTKRRVLECFLETAKQASRGKQLKFKYISSDSSEQVMQFDGDEFAENDYGLVIDASSDVLNLDQKLETLAQAALQTQRASFSDIMKIWTSTSSLAEKIRTIQASEDKMYRQQQEASQQQQQMQQQQIEADLAKQQMQFEHEAAMNTEDNETKILIAQMQQQDPQGDGIVQPMSETDKAKLAEQIREFDIKIKQNNKALEIQRERNNISRATKTSK